MMKHILKMLMVTLVVVHIYGCNPDDNVMPAGKYENGVLIINEGNFTDGDGSVSFYNPDTEDIHLKIFKEENGRPFGGLLQSVTVHNGKAYLIDNLGSKIEVVEAGSFKWETTISEDLSLPRFFAAIDNKAYVSNWGPYAPDFTSPDSYIAVIDLDNMKVIKKIDVNSAPEGIIVVGEKLFVSSQTTSEISIIDTGTDTITGTIPVGFGPAHFVTDSQGRIWVACTGGVLYAINPVTEEIAASVEIENLTGRISINQNTQSIYLLTSTWAPDYSYTENEVVTLNTGSPDEVRKIFATRNLYGLGVDSASGVIYLANSNAFLGNGTIIKINPEGTETGNFPAGRGPNGFVFR